MDDVRGDILGPPHGTSLYLLNMLMDQVDTLHGGRYWSEVLCCTIMTQLGDVKVKITNLEILR